MTPNAQHNRRDPGLEDRERLDHVPSAPVKLRLHEPGPYYTPIGFGSMTWRGPTISPGTRDPPPNDVRKILRGIAANYDERAGIVNQQERDRVDEELRGLDRRGRD